MELYRLTRRLSRDRVRLLKMDCEGAEWQISNQWSWPGELDEYREIIGEIHTVKPEWNVEHWRRIMAAHGLTTEFETNPHYDYLTLFWSKRP